MGEADIGRAKALLQTIHKAARIYRDGRIELEFRGYSLFPHSLPIASRIELYEMH